MPKFDPRVDELLAIVRDVVDPLGVEYAIGGALAMAAHGYARHTSDVDLFVKEEGRSQVLRALRGAGLNILEVFRPHHYAAFKPEHEDPEVRIDIMVPAGEPDLSAIEWAGRTSISPGSAKLSVVEPDLLAMMKFYSDRDDDDADLRRLYERGIFDPEKVRLMIISIDDDENTDTTKWDALIKRFDRKRPPSRKPTRKPTRQR